MALVTGPGIGGIAHAQVAGRGRTMAFDTGPGRVMIDRAMRRLSGRPHDGEGEVAAGGQVDRAMLAKLQSHPSFARPIPRPAWRLGVGSAPAEGAPARVGGLALVASGRHGIPAQPREAVTFATLARATVHGLANTIRAASGASAFGILGTLVQPLRLAKVRPGPRTGRMEDTTCATQGGNQCV